MAILMETTTFLRLAFFANQWIQLQRQGQIAASGKHKAEPAVLLEFAHLTETEVGWIWDMETSNEAMIAIGPALGIPGELGGRLLSPVRHIPAISTGQA